MISSSQTGGETLKIIAECSNIGGRGFRNTKTCYATLIHFTSYKIHQKHQYESSNTDKVSTVLISLLFYNHSTLKFVLTKHLTSSCQMFSCYLKTQMAIVKIFLLFQLFLVIKLSNMARLRILLLKPLIIFGVAIINPHVSFFGF